VKRNGFYNVPIEGYLRELSTLLSPGVKLAADANGGEIFMLLRGNTG